jgi:hypothetical protein
VWDEIEEVTSSYPEPGLNETELDGHGPVLLIDEHPPILRVDDQEGDDDGSEEEEVEEEDDPTRPRFIKDGEFHKGRDKTRKIWHGRCSWCKAHLRSHRSFIRHRKETCPEVRRRSAEDAGGLVGRSADRSAYRAHRATACSAGGACASRCAQVACSNG